MLQVWQAPNSCAAINFSWINKQEQDMSYCKEARSHIAESSNNNALVMKVSSLRLGRSSWNSKGKKEFLCELRRASLLQQSMYVQQVTQEIINHLIDAILIVSGRLKRRVRTPTPFQHQRHVVSTDTTRVHNFDDKKSRSKNDAIEILHNNYYICMWIGRLWRLDLL